MVWYILALHAAFVRSVKGVLLKRLAPSAGPTVTTWAYSLVSSVILWAIVIARGPQWGGPEFTTAVIVGSVAGAAATVLYVRALTVADLSLIGPLGSLTVLPAVLVALAIHGEIPSLLGLTGAFAVMGGTYLLGVRHGSGRRFFDPVRALWNERGARLMLLCVLINAFNASVDRWGIKLGGADLWSACVISGWVVLLTPFVFIKARAQEQRLTSLPWKHLVILGTIAATGSLAYSVAVGEIPIAYAVALKQTSALFSVAFGGVMFGERSLSFRFAGSGLIGAGVLLIAIG